MTDWFTGGDPIVFVDTYQASTHPIAQEQTVMADASIAGDISDDRLNLILAETLQNHSAQMHEQRANGESAMNIARHSSVRKFDQEDAIESAAIEKIMQS